MHAAPPVRIDLAPDRTAGRAVLLLTALAAANAALWLGALAELKGTNLAALGLAAAIAVAWPLRRKRLGCEGLLAWDGSAWLWQPAAPASVAGAPVQPRVMLDLGRWMLLRLQLPRQGGSRAVLWGVATRERSFTAWSAWRAALLAQGRTAQPPRRTPA